MNHKNEFNNDTKKMNIPIKIKNYRIEKELFPISNGYICLAQNINIKEKVLIKIYDKELFLHNSDEILLINNEIYIMRIINHKHCLKLYEIIESPSFIYLIMEYSSGYKLTEYMSKKIKFSEEESLNIYKQLISVLLYFQEMKIGNLNINSDNIIIDTNNNIKLFDFQYSILYSNDEKIKIEQTGDKNYLCPELWSEKACFPELADIWSSGVLLYYLLIGQLPFKGINDFDLQKKIMGVEFPLPLNISKNMQDLFKNIFEPKIESRYNLEKILNSPLFKEKKITKNILPKGFNILTTKYPFDERVIDICKTYFEIEPENLKQKLTKNIFDPQTSLYKQIISSFIRKRISTEIDLISKKYNSYITNTNNSFNEDIKNNNIKENLNKYQEIKKLYPDQKTKTIKNQNLSLNKINELMKKYNIPEAKPKDSEPENMKEKEKEKGKEEQKKPEIKQVKKENISKNKNDIKYIMDDFKKQNINKNTNNKKRGSIYLLPFNFKSKKSNNIENKSNTNSNPGYRRRQSTAFNTNFKLNLPLERRNSKGVNGVNPIEKKKTQGKKYISNHNDIIKESNEEEKKQSNESSIKSSRSSSVSKTPETKKEKEKENKNDINTPKDKDKKGLKVNSVPNKQENNQIEKKKTIVAKTPQMNKEDFFSQLRGVKLKKFTPGTNSNPDEIKKKIKEENKNASPIHFNKNSSSKGVRQMIEENTKNSKNNIHNFDEQKGKNFKNKPIANTPLKPPNSIENKIKSETLVTLKKNEKQKNEKEKPNKFLRQRKSINFRDVLMFKTKGVIIDNDEIKNEKSKDDTNRLKLGSQKKEIPLEEDLIEIKIPKTAKPEKKKNEEQKIVKENQEKIQKEKEGDKKRKEENQEKIQKEKEGDKKRKEELEKKRKEDNKKKLKEEELKLKQEEEKKLKKELEKQERLKKEKVEKEEKKRKKKEEEERLRKEKEEEEEKIKKELEKQEKLRKKQEEERKKREEAEKLRKEKEEEEEKIKREFEEQERLRKELEEEERKKREEEERLRKEKEEEEEKKRKKREEIERIRKEQEEEEKRKEEEERLRKEKEREKLRLEEEERINKWKMEKRIQKENEERIRKESEEKQKKEEEAKIIKRKEEIERKKKEIQEENQKRMEEFEKKRKEDEEKKIIREKMKQKKEEELRQKREMELKTIRVKKNTKNKKIESDSDSLSDDITPKEHLKNNINSKEKLKIKQKEINARPKLFDFNKFTKPETQMPEIESSEEEIIENKENKKNKDNIQIEQKNTNTNTNKNSMVYDKFSDFFFSDNKKNNKIKNKPNAIVKNVKFKEKKENKNKQKIFYHYQGNQDKNKNNSNNRSLEILNNQPKYKDLYPTLQSNSNIINEDYLTQRRNNQKNFKKLKVKTIKKNKRNNNIHPIKIKNLNSKTTNKSKEKEIITEINDNKEIKANNAFKKKSLGKIFFRNKKIVNKKALSQDYIGDYDQQILRYSTIFNNNLFTSSKNELKKSNNNDSLKKNQLKNYKTLNFTKGSESSNDSISSNNDEKSSKYNRTYQSKSKIQKKIKNSYSISKNDLNDSNKSNKTIIKIRRNSPKKRNNIKENELSLYKGDIDYNEVSMKNVKETIAYLIKKYKNDGYTCIKKGLAKYKFYKDTNICLVEIMRLGNGLLYYNVTKA